MEKLRGLLKGKLKMESFDNGASDPSASASNSPYSTTAGPDKSKKATATSVKFRYGLREPVFEDKDPQIDVIAVHGLNGDRVNTWTEGDVFWLRDLLPCTLRSRGIRARIFSYGYNADASSSDAVSVQDLWGHGEAFLSAVVTRREIDKVIDRPIAFIVHSLGGLILKSALIMSNSSTPDHFPDSKSLSLSTHGIIFCGVPHQGGNGTALGEIILKIGSVMTHTTTKIVRILEPQNEVLETQFRSYMPIAGRFHTVPLFETEETPIALGKTLLIVPRSSAVMEAQTGQKYKMPVGLDGKNHVTMVKFSSSKDSAYETLSSQLLLMLTKSYRDVYDRWDIWNRDLKEKDFAGIRLRPKLPYAPNTRFCGREDEINKIRLGLDSRHDNKQNIVAIHGAGGMGKTQLTLEYVYRYQKKYASVLWINAASKSTAEAAYIHAMEDLISIEARNAPNSQPSFSKIGRELDIIGLVDSNGALILPEDDERAKRRVIEGVKKWLARDICGNWLLIFDNHDDMSFPLREFFPACPWGSIIITSRRPDVKDYATAFHQLDKLDETSSIRLLLIVSERDENDAAVRSQAQKIVQRLDYLPLAIDQAAAYIANRPHKPLESYIPVYERKEKELLGDNERSWPDYNLTCMTTWEISRLAIRKDSRPATALLQVCSFFNNIDIWGELLRRSFTFEGKSLSEDEVDNLIARLYSYHLIKPTLAADTFSMHAIIHAWARERLDPEDRMFTAVGAASMLKDAILSVCKQHEIRSITEYTFEKRLLPHMEYFLRASDSIFGATAMRKSLETVNYPDMAFRGRVLSVVDTALSTTKLHQNHSSTEAAQGSPLIGKRYYTSTNPVDPQFSNTIHDVRAISYTSMIVMEEVFGRQGRHRASVSITVALIYFMLGFSEGQNVSAIVTHIGNLAGQLRDTENYREAEPLYRFAIAEWPPAASTAVEQTGVLKSGLASMLSKLGRYDEANDIILELQPIGSLTRADLNDNELTRLSNEAINLERQGKFEAAEKSHRSVLEARRRIHGSQHPDTCTTLNSLAVVLEKQNKLTEAEQLHREALASRQAFLSEGHDEILRSMSNLAVTLKKQGKFNEATKLYSEAIQFSTQWRGETHSETLRTSKNLAVLWAVQRDFERAEPEMGRCTEGLTTTLGLDHPATLDAIASWGNILRDMGRLDAACDRYWSILQVRLRKPAQDSPTRQAFLGLQSVERIHAQKGQDEMAGMINEKTRKFVAELQARVSS